MEVDLFVNSQSNVVHGHGRDGEACGQDNLAHDYHCMFFQHVLDDTAVHSTDYTTRDVAPFCLDVPWPSGSTPAYRLVCKRSQHLCESDCSIYA